ncbi:hypothetical protein C5167_041374 [Papaver somniferum]|nr:hypothetical protein C5167_041374 [Papaver somniferum]
MFSVLFAAQETGLFLLMKPMESPYEQIAQVEEEGNDPLGGEFTATPDRGRLIFEKTNENKR